MGNEYFITIINESPLPVNVDTWQSLYFGISEMKSILIKPGERQIMSSETGEWFINTYIFNNAMCEEWTKAGYTPGKVLGKFRSEPAIRGENAWLFDDDFQIICSNGVAKFSKRD